MASFVVVADSVAYGPFDERAVADWIADQIGREDDSPAYVVELVEWRNLWTQTVRERIVSTRRPRVEPDPGHSMRVDA